MMPIEEHVFAVIAAADGPLSFGDVKSGVHLRCGETIGFRDVDRALQKLRRRKAVEYVKSTGTKGSHGWRVPLATNNDSNSNG